MTTRSADECEMSRSCQSATFSSPTTRGRANDARQAADPLGDLIGLRLCGIADEPFCPLRERLLDLAHLGARRCRISSANGSSDAPTSASAYSSSAWRSRGDHLRRDRPGSRPRRSQAMRSTSGSTAAYVPTAPESLPTRDPLERARAAASRVAVELERPDGELQPERGRLGVDAVRAADHRRLPVLLGARDDGGERAVEPSRIKRAGVAHLQRRARCRRTSDDVSP